MLVSTQSLREQMPSSVDAVLELTRRGVAVLSLLCTRCLPFGAIRQISNDCSKIEAQHLASTDAGQASSVRLALQPRRWDLSCSCQLSEGYESCFHAHSIERILQTSMGWRQLAGYLLICGLLADLRSRPLAPSFNQGLGVVEFATAKCSDQVANFRLRVSPLPWLDSIKFLLNFRCNTNTPESIVRNDAFLQRCKFPHRWLTHWRISIGFDLVIAAVVVLAIATLMFYNRSARSLSNAKFEWRHLEQIENA